VGVASLLERPALSRSFLVSGWWTMTLPPRVSLRKALRSPALVGVSGRRTRCRAGAQLGRCVPQQPAVGRESCQQARAERASWCVSQPVPMQRPGRWGLYAFACVLITLPARYCRSVLLTWVPSVPSVQLPGPLLHSRSAPRRLSSPVPPPVPCAPAPVVRAPCMPQAQVHCLCSQQHSYLCGTPPTSCVSRGAWEALVHTK